MSTRETVQTPLSKLFFDKTWSRLDMQDNEYCHIYKEPHERTPKLDPLYSFPLSPTIEVLNVIQKPLRNNIWVSGPTGSGKSTLIRNLAAKFNASLRSINCHKDMKPSSFFGRWRARAGETFFDEGIVAKWLREGGWLLLNEYDTLEAECTNALKSVLEYPRTLVLTDYHDAEIVGHPECRLIVTCNTRGRGDDTGMFVNTNTQSIADLRRFDAFIDVDYITELQEREMLTVMFPNIPEDMLKKVTSVAAKSREAFKKGASGRVLSTAEVITWCDNILIFANSPHLAARVTFLNAYEAKERMGLRDIINAVFGQEDAALLTNDVIAARAAAKAEEG